MEIRHRKSLQRTDANENQVGLQKRWKKLCSKYGKVSEIHVQIGMGRRFLALAAILANIVITNCENEGLRNINPGRNA